MMITINAIWLQVDIFLILRTLIGYQSRMPTVLVT